VVWAFPPLIEWESRKRARGGRGERLQHKHKQEQKPRARSPNDTEHRSAGMEKGTEDVLYVNHATCSQEEETVL